MSIHWIDITEIPAEGREFSFSDTDLWSDSIKEFGVNATVDQGLDAGLTVRLIERSCSYEGYVRGTITVPCDRCLAAATVEVDQNFSGYENLDEEIPQDESFIREEDEQIELDAGSILWEQFVLALPAKPLCDENCKGMCPQCGVNLNEKSCDCEQDQGDPRMAALRGLKIAKRKN